MARWLLAQTPDPGDGFEEIQEQFQGLEAWDWIVAGIIVFAAIVLAQVLRRLVIRLIRKEEGDDIAGRLAGRVVAYVIVLAGLVWALESLGVTIGLLLGALGIGGLVLALALQDTMENFVSSLFIETRRPFRRGDQIETADHEGIVEDINLRTTVIRTFDGIRVFVPNSMVIRNEIVNRTAYDSRRTTLVVGVEYATDLDRAQEVLLEAVRGIEDVRMFPHPEAYVKEFADSAINFAVRYWHRPDEATYWRVRDEVARTIKHALDEAGITIAFPQRTLWFANRLEATTDDGRGSGAEPGRPVPGSG